MSELRKSRLKEDLQSVVEILRTFADADASSPRFVLTEYDESSIRFLYIANGEKEEDASSATADSDAIVEYSLSCCFEEYPSNTVVSCSLEPNKMTIANQDLPSLLKDLRETALATQSPPLPSKLQQKQAGRRRSIALTPSPTEIDPRKMRKIRSSSHPAKLADFCPMDISPIAIVPSGPSASREDSGDEGQEEEGYSSQYDDDDDYEDNYEDIGDDEEFEVALEDTINPLLIQDINIMREWWGTESIEFKIFEALDEIEVDLNVDVSFLDDETALAWNISRIHPIIVQLSLSLSRYLDGKKPTVKVKQKNAQKETGLGLQLQKILESFVGNQWDKLSNSLVTKECLWKPRSKSLALAEFCSDHARLEAKDDDGRCHTDSGYCVEPGSPLPLSGASGGESTTSPLEEVQIEAEIASSSKPCDAASGTSGDDYADPSSSVTSNLRANPAGLLDRFISQLMEMGFEREQSFNALQVCSNYRLHDLNTEEFNAIIAYIVEKAANLLLSNSADSKTGDNKRKKQDGNNGEKQVTSPMTAVTNILSVALSDASLNSNDSYVPSRPLPHSPALPSISSHHPYNPQHALYHALSSPLHFRQQSRPAAFSGGDNAVSSVSLTTASSPSMPSRHPRPCFTALPSVEKSQSTQALVHVKPPSSSEARDHEEVFVYADAATAEDGIARAITSSNAMMVHSNKNESQPVLSGNALCCDGLEVCALPHSLIKGARSASCSNVPERSLSECPEEVGVDIHDDTAKLSPHKRILIADSPLTATTSGVRPKERLSSSSSRITGASLASLKSKTAAASSPPKSNISVDSAIHAEMKGNSPSSSSAKESGSSSSSYSFSFMPSAVIRKLPAVFGRGSGSPGRKRNAMKPTASQHKALAELASNGELQLLPCNTLSGTQSRVVPKLIRGFLAQTYQYARQRIPTLNEFCVVCDRSHLFQNGSCMLKPAVCARELCVFAFSNLNVMGDAADSVSTAAEVVDLLIAMAKSSCKSPRKTLIFDPFPIVVDPENPGELAFNPKKPDYQKAAAAMDSFPEMRRVTSLVGSALKRMMDGVDKLGYPLLNWIISSNRSHIVKLPVDKQLDFMHTPHQFLLLCSPPTKETAFRGLKREHGSTFAFHGSKFENWHSILRNGLYNASGTRHQMNGAAYGSGIYLSPIASVSFGYSGMGHGNHAVKTAAKNAIAGAKASKNPAAPPAGGGGSNGGTTPPSLPSKKSGGTTPPLPSKKSSSSSSSSPSSQVQVANSSFKSTSSQESTFWIASHIHSKLSVSGPSLPGPPLLTLPPTGPSTSGGGSSSGSANVVSFSRARSSSAAAASSSSRPRGNEGSSSSSGATASLKSLLKLPSSNSNSKKQHFLQSKNLSCIALCEVITTPELKRNGSIWVCPNSDHVCTRFFFVYEDGQVGDANIDTTSPKYETRILDAITSLMKDLRHCNEGGNSAYQ